LRDALRNVAGISLAAGEGGAQGDNLTIRGFTARNDIFLDGMRDFGSYYRDSFNYEEVDVLQGPTSVTFGRGSTGGVVNQESKVPVDRHLIGGSLVFGSDATRRITADINEPIGKQTAFRLNLMGVDQGVAGRDIAAEFREAKRDGLAEADSGPGDERNASAKIKQFPKSTWLNAHDVKSQKDLELFRRNRAMNSKLR